MSINLNTTDTRINFSDPSAGSSGIGTDFELVFSILAVRCFLWLGDEDEEEEEGGGAGGGGGGGCGRGGWWGREENGTLCHFEGSVSMHLSELY